MVPFFGGSGLAIVVHVTKGTNFIVLVESLSPSNETSHERATTEFTTALLDCRTGFANQALPGRAELCRADRRLRGALERRWLHISVR